MQAESHGKQRKHPRQNANLLSKLFFLHTLPVFWRNFKTGLEEENLFEVLDDHRSSTVGDNLESLWNTEHQARKKYALHVALLKMFYWDFVATGILQGFKAVCVIIVMPYAVGQLVSYFGNRSTLSKNDAFIFAAVIVLCLLTDRLISHFVWMWLKHLSMKIRLGCCSLVYRKSLRLSLRALQLTNIGQIVNLLSNDASKIDVGLVLCHYIWTAPLQTAIATYLLYNIIGASAFSGIVFILSIVPIQIYLGKRNSVVRLKTAHRTDERVRLMNEILAGIQIIKMYTWEKAFAKLISLVRRLEMKSIRLHFYIESFIFSLDMFVSRTAIFITIIIYLHCGHKINASIVYSITAIYSIIRTAITIIFSVAVANLGETHITISRVEQFLSHEEIEVPSTETEQTDRAKIPKIVFKDVVVKWSPGSKSIALANIDLCIEQSQVVAIIGPVGSGKSTLFSTILGELPITSGNLEITGKISYAAQEPWLFLGTVRQNILFGDPFDEARYKTVVKACALESDFKLLPQGDYTMVREKGKSLSGGQRARINLARCAYKQADIYLLDDPLSAVDAKVGKQLYNECIQEVLKNKICILITHQLQYLQNANKIVILSNGKITDSGTYTELQNSRLDFAQLLKGNHDTDEKQDPECQNISDLDNIMYSNSYDAEDGAEDTKEHVSSKKLGLSTYLDYLKMGGNFCIILSVLLLFVTAHTTCNGSDLFLSKWVNSLQRTDNNTMLSEYGYVTIYTGITTGIIVLALAHSTVFFMFFVRASKKIHDIIFEKIIYATMQFFNNNPTGRILNRFSKDLGIVDEYIPFVFIDVVDVIFGLFATIILSCIINVWFSLPCIGLLLVLYFIRIIYIETSRQVKRIEGITRSPIYNHAAASVHGLTTIRAFKAEKTLINEYDSIQDHHSSAWYLYISSSEAFGLWIDLTCILFIALIMYSLLLVDEGYQGGDVGLIITIYIALAGLLQWGIFQWSELENNMVSVERVLEYTKQEMEPKRPPISNVPINWPEFGEVIFQNLSMQYVSGGEQVLKNLNFVVAAGEKVGVVGRTGAGKTSTISALFQFYPLTGTIIVDGVDATKVPLETLRSKISIIPQECVLFSGTMRKNLDPFGEYSDKILWDALEQVEIKKFIEQTPGGLNSSISESGANFSIGQRQLICLARAIIRNNKIIVMDEATANIDSYTDILIQKAIKKNFANCTIITIAHRLHTVMDSDKILVMDKGEVREFDTPYNLLQNKDGIFYNLVQTTGSASARHLQSIAQQKHESLKIGDN